MMRTGNFTNAQLLESLENSNMTLIAERNKTFTQVRQLTDQVLTKKRLADKFNPDFVKDIDSDLVNTMSKNIKNP